MSIRLVLIKKMQKIERENRFSGEHFFLILTISSENFSRSDREFGSFQKIRETQQEYVYNSQY